MKKFKTIVNMGGGYPSEYEIEKKISTIREQMKMSEVERSVSVKLYSQNDSLNHVVTVALVLDDAEENAKTNEENRTIFISVADTINENNVDARIAQYCKNNDCEEIDRKIEEVAAGLCLGRMHYCLAITSKFRKIART